jgi:hypothetical protein
MGRYQFTAHDLGTLGLLLRIPVVQDSLAAAVPIKRFSGPAVQRLEAIELAVPVASRANPDGVPLHAVLAAARAEAPGIQGLQVRDGKVIATFEGKASAAQQKRVGELLRDRRKLLALQRERLPVPGDAERELAEKLRDDATPTAEWNKTFREFAKLRLLEPGGGR